MSLKIGVHQIGRYQQLDMLKPACLSKGKAFTETI